MPDHSAAPETDFEQAAHRTLRDVFGYEQFRGRQLEIIQSLVEGA